MEFITKCLGFIVFIHYAFAENEEAAKRFSVEYEWSHINYTWPSADAYSSAIESKEYIPENNAMVGIKIYKDNIYIALPKVRRGVPVTLATISLTSSNKTNQLLKPFPSWEMNDVKKSCSTLQSVQSMEIDSKGIMWVIDGMRMANSTKCPGKIILFDLNDNGKVIRTYIFPEQIALSNQGYLNDIVVDESDGGFAYITDNSPIDPGLVIYSYAKNKAWKIRDRTMFAEIELGGITLEGATIQQKQPIDGIALSPVKNEERYVYYTSIIGLSLYSINTKLIKDEELCLGDEWRENVTYVGRKQNKTGGLTMDSEGTLYYTLLPLYAVGEWDSSKPFTESKILDQNKEILVWPDSFAFDNKGYLYLLADNMFKFVDTSYPLQLSSKILFRVVKLFRGTKSYMYE